MSIEPSANSLHRQVGCDDGSCMNGSVAFVRSLSTFIVSSCISVTCTSVCACCRKLASALSALRRKHVFGGTVKLSVSHSMVRFSRRRLS